MSSLYLRTVDSSFRAPLEGPGQSKILILFLEYELFRPQFRLTHLFTSAASE
jgi:hypothetical protein